MKIYCFEWVGGLPGERPAWWRNKKEVEISPQQIIDLFNTGMNVALIHPNLVEQSHSTEVPILAIDNKRFTQR